MNAMMFVLGVVLLLVVLIVLAVLLDIAKSLRDIRESLTAGMGRREIPWSRLRADLLGSVRADLSAHRVDLTGAVRADLFDPTIGFAVWSFRRGQWEMIEDHCAPGYAPGTPPTLPGAHENYRIRQEGVPVSLSSVP